MGSHHRPVSENLGRFERTSTILGHVLPFVERLPFVFMRNSDLKAGSSPLVKRIDYWLFCIVGTGIVIGSNIGKRQRQSSMS